MDSMFVRPLDTYKREIDPVKDYIEQNTFLLMRSTGKTEEECRAYIVDYIKNKKSSTINNPIVRYFERQENGDREVREVKLTEYIKTVVSEKEALAPTMTSYLDPSKKKSLIAKVVKKNAKLRSAAKKKMFAAEAAGNINEYGIQDSIQSTKKGTSNSISGLFAAFGSVLQNRSAHSTLTSTTRTMGSFGNCGNERILSGSRLYMTPLIAYSNILFVANNTDAEVIRKAIEEYGMKYPSVDDVMDCVIHSTKLYFDNATELKKIRELVKKLTNEERAAFVYSGDFYHIRIHNENLVRKFLGHLSEKITGSIIQDPAKVIETADETIVTMAHFVCADEVRGLGKDLKVFEEKGVIHTVAATVLNIQSVLNRYENLIKTFIVTDNLPPNVAFTPEMTRRVVPVSDTDSTCFSTDEWITWYFGEFEITSASIAVAAGAAFITEGAIKHVLAKFSANIGVSLDLMHILAMKNEYCWPIMGLTPITKHYWALALAREGNIHAKLKAEIKGVHLKNSSSPAYINKAGERLMLGSLEEIIETKTLDPVKAITTVSDVERRILSSLKNSETEFLRSAKIKDAKAYKKPETESPYRNHQFWIDVFEDKYGKLQVPPYSVVKIPTILRNKTAIRNWITNIEDEKISTKLADYFERTGRDSFNTIYLSEDYVTSYGIPKEIAMIMNSKKIVLDLTRTFRIVLETLGQFFKPTLTLMEHGY